METITFDNNSNLEFSRIVISFVGRGIPRGVYGRFSRITLLEKRKALKCKSNRSSKNSHGDAVVHLKTLEPRIVEDADSTRRALTIDSAIKNNRKAIGVPIPHVFEASH